jgi:nitrous oxide reductase accessory protein NosL
MKRFMLFMVMCLLFTGFSAIAAEKADKPKSCNCGMGKDVSATGNVESPRSCKQCGMDRVAFAHGRMLILYADGTTVGTCSLNCAAVDMKENKGKKVKELRVADYGTKKLVDARTAVWVIGGSRDGIMTSVPKWAFSGKADAEKFVKENGGRITDFDEALNLALRENE